VKFVLVPINKKHTKANFDCGHASLNQYFRHYALKNDQLSIGKTFVAITENEEIAGYITISSAQILCELLPEELQKKLPKYPVPAFRIGRLAVDSTFQGHGCGRWLLTQALKKALDISSSIGIFAIIVDAIDDNAKSFYLKYGFITFPAQPLTLFLPLATLKDALHV
jgi:GNAT superfamily N-acetyltransferase